MASLAVRIHDLDESSLDSGRVGLDDLSEQEDERH